MRWAFHGQGASIGLRLMNASRSATNAEICVCMRGYRASQPGDHVRLSVDGEVIAYPR
jgi:hypothetical protein